MVESEGERLKPFHRKYPGISMRLQANIPRLSGGDDRGDVVCARDPAEAVLAPMRDFFARKVRG